MLTVNAPLLSLILPNILLAALISEKHNQQYSTTLHWMRCCQSLSLIRSAIMCLRGARSTYHHPTFSGDSMDVACSEGRIFSRTEQL